MSSEVDVTKLKVHELRAELGKRGLNTFGTKQVLMDRLNEYLKSAQDSKDNTEDLCDSPSKDVPEPCDVHEPSRVDSSEVARNPFDEISDQKVNERMDTVENGVGSVCFSKTVFQVYTEKPNAEVDPRQIEVDYQKRKRSPSRSPRRRSRSRDRDSRRSPRRRSRSPSLKSKMCDEPPDWEKSSAVFLDGYNCDLHLLIDASGYNAKPLTEGGFSLMWAGVRANYGIVSGKAYFEVRVVRNLHVDSYDTQLGGATHVLRVGWSTEDSGFALGEEPFSYGFGGTAKKSTNNKFADYGCSFDEGDVVGSFLEITRTDAILRFSVNGVDQGECYNVPKSSFGPHNAMFPHIYVKNVEFSVNFGQDSQPAWFCPNIPGDDPTTWQLINNTDPSVRVHGRLPPASKAECEVIMMVGLPGCGKTYFAERYCNEHREQQYNVLGTNLILEKMKVLGLARQRNYHGRWDVLIDKATKCLNTLISVACLRRRNYILDQTNVYPSAQRRKMRPFEGFKRRAIVIIPTDEEFRRRIAQREKEEGKEVPESAVLEMKANFGLPKPVSEDSSSVFDEVIFTELGPKESQLLIEQYNQEGQTSKPPPEKRQRWDDSHDRNRGSSHDSRFPNHDSRDRGRDSGRGRQGFRRSPNRRDDRGHRDYRGGYSASRDRSRDNDRFDKSRDRESFGRQSGGRYGGPGGRYGGPPSRGGFPPGVHGGYRGFDGPRGGVMRGGPIRGGPGRGGPMDRGGYGSRGFDGTRGSRGTLRGSMDPMYGNRFNVPNVAPDATNTYNTSGDVTGLPPFDGELGGPASSGFRGSYGAPTSGRDALIVSNRGTIPGRQIGRGGPPRGRDSGRGERGGPPVRSRGGPFPDRNVRSSRDAGAFPDDNYHSYSNQEEFPGLGDAAYSGMNSNNYGSRSRDRGSNAAYGHDGSKSSATGYTGNYQRENAFASNGPPGYPNNSYSNLGGYPNANAGPNFVTTGSYPTDPPGYDMYAGPDASITRGNRAVAPVGPTETDKPKAQPERSTTDGTSLYASGTTRFSDNRLSGQAQTTPRQSRFDKSPTNAPPTSFSTYPAGGNYPAAYGGSYSHTPTPTQAASVGNSTGTRSGRSRFDVGPGSTVTSAPDVQSRPQQCASVQPQSTQQYNYGYPGSKSEGALNQPGQSAHPPVNQTSYGSYGYGYGYNAYGTQNAQAPPPQTSGRPSGSSVSSAPSLYASAVADKPQVSQHSTQSASTTATSSVPAGVAAAAYASYYYGTPMGTSVGNQPSVKYDAAMAAAQQFNAWQHQQPSTISANAPAASSSVASTAPAASVAPGTYAGYYPGYSAYPAGYAPAPAAGAVGGTSSGTNASSAQAMAQYYAGYH